MSVLSPVLFNTLRACILHFPFQKGQGPRFESVTFAFTILFSQILITPFLFLDGFMMYSEFLRLISSYQYSFLKCGTGGIEVSEIWSFCTRTTHGV